MVAQLQRLFFRGFDAKRSDIPANARIDLMPKMPGLGVGNQAARDVRAHMQVKRDDRDGEVFADGDR